MVCNCLSAILLDKQFKAMRNFFKEVPAEEAQSQLLQSSDLSYYQKEEQQQVSRSYIVNFFIQKMCCAAQEKCPNSSAALQHTHDYEINVPSCLLKTYLLSQKD